MMAAILRPQLPSGRESRIFGGALVLCFGAIAALVGLRPEHWLLFLLVAVMFFFNGPTRRLVVALLPFVVFGLSYDFMNIAHNYEVNPPVDIRGLYESEKSLFGIATAQGVLTPNEFFALHKSALLDLLGGIFYLCWVPVPIAFGLYLYFRGERRRYLHFSLVFLLVNLIGFCGYYIHPAAPPWYVATYGFDFIEGVPGQVAGLAGFGDITGWHVFEGLYARNSNVFAAVPSLHSAYMPVALYYALTWRRCPLAWKILLAILTVGIWFTAVYTFHHYLIDVLLGIATAALGIAIFELGLMRIPSFGRFLDRYTRYIGG